MNATTVVVVPAEKAEHIQNIFDGLVGLGCQLARAADGVRDGIVLKPVLKSQSILAQEYCLAAGVLVAEGWLRMVMVQGQLKGFIRAYPRTAEVALPANILLFPLGKCEKGPVNAVPGAVVPLRRR
jgi:hypothetical protein